MELISAFLIALVVCVLTLWYLRLKPRNFPRYSIDKVSQNTALSQIDLLPMSYLSPSVSLLPLSPSCITYISTRSGLTSIFPVLMSSSHLGIDLEETRENSYLGRTCLIQISTPSHTYLIDPLSLNHHILALSPIFSAESITKIFHGAHNDVNWLYRDYGFVCVNVFDTQFAAKLLGIHKLGLNHLWEEFCQYVMASEYKKKMQTSDWKKRPLNEEQIFYGALDSHYLIYLMQRLLAEMDSEKIREMRKEMNRVCRILKNLENNEEKGNEILKKYAIQAIDSRTRFLFFEMFKARDTLARKLDLPLSKVCSNQVLVQIAFEKPSKPELIQSYSDWPLVSHLSSLISTLIQESLSQQLEILKEFKHESQIRKEKKQERYKSFLEKYTIKGKVFENCQIQKPNGELLCYADHKKSNWYLQRNLASVIQNEPLIVRLTFEPNLKNITNEELDRMYFKKEKRNECVCCGSAQSFLRYRVVPLLYRKFFSDKFKSMCRHDVVLLCANCHEIANKHCDELKKTIADEFQVPLNFYGEKFKIKEEILSIRKVCTSLMKNSEKMPKARVEVLKREIMEFVERNQQFLTVLRGLGVEEVVRFCSDGENLKKMLDCFGEVDWKTESFDYHGKIVVEKIEDIKGFVKRWKTHFIKCMKPQFLPDSWKADEEFSMYCKD